MTWNARAKKREPVGLNHAVVPASSSAESSPASESSAPTATDVDARDQEPEPQLHEARHAAQAQHH
eukprot:CAMPEP_0174851332 /NCGR_PEP_ID=MMETSP1114-20130205/22988_1 /TAXON_ID=312471 /ORGANISM="Neobodo designis, Strain CCAP 1951/1" /LENGTH=65 /DNA_ID=CAMNT_0016085863 /DNA_START=158 /DNA_END=351 /DNA_ORIENTATION=+